MTDRKKSILNSLDAEDDRLYPYLVYLFQDLWDIGSSPAVVSHLIIKNKLHKNQKLKVLDLGCGKGAIAVTLAKEFGFSVHAIDAQPDFIKEARAYAGRFHVKTQCRFEIADIRQAVKKLHDYDLLILGSLGDLMGTIGETLGKVVSTVREGGYIFLDEGYLKEELSTDQPESDDTKKSVLAQIKQAPVNIMDEFHYPSEKIRMANQYMYSCLEKRAFQLMDKQPQLKSLFENYLLKQKLENSKLEEQYQCVMWILQKKAVSPKLLL